MLTKQMKLALILTAAMGTSALAQEATVIETPDGTTAVVPTDATTTSAPAPVATVVISDYPVFNQDMNDANIIDMLVGQGFKDIYILREGSLMTVTATREGDDIKLVYNLVEGRLIEVNGERVLSEDEKDPATADDNAAGTPAAAEAGGDMTEGTDDATDDATDDGVTGEGATDDSATDDGAADDGAADDSATDEGTDSTDDGATDGGATDDSGSDSPDGGDSETNG